MRLLLPCVAFLILSTGLVGAERPAIVALSSTTSVCVKLTDTAGYTGSDLSYEIRHLPDGARFASGTVKASAVETDGCGLRNFTVGNLQPKLWSPQTPELYEVIVTAPDGRALGKARFGFRTFEANGDKLYLNGRPVFIRSVPINPPGRDLDKDTERNPEFYRGYIKLLKSAGVNMIRTEPQDWLDACDELGMMVFTGHYGGAPGGKNGNPPTFEHAQPFYRDRMLSLASHPGVVIYVLTNEVDYKSPGSTYKQFLTQVREDIRKLDPTRPVIGNAGFGHGEPGEIYDIHPYTGWYNSNLCDWYSTYATYVANAAKANQPLTLSECVGAYTDDAGDFLTMSKQMSTMTKWVGGAENPRADALEYQAELVRQVVEIGRRQRTAKTSVAGVMPFTYFMGWANAKKSQDLIIKPAFETLRTVYQPVLISPECWHRNLYSGDSLSMRLCVVDDDDSGRALAASTASVDVVDSTGRIVASGTTDFTAVPHYSNAWAGLSIPIPADTQKGYYEVRCKLVEGGNEISHNSFRITVAPRDWVKPPLATVALYDPSGDTARALKQLKVSFTPVASLKQLPKDGVLVIGEGALDSGYPEHDAVLAFTARGGRILCLRQDAAKWNSGWLPARFTMPAKRPFTYLRPMGDNTAIFDGLTDRDLRYWNELGRLTNTTPDVHPVLSALKPASVEDLRSARVWAACDQLLGATALLELYHGSGSIILNQFRVTERAATDPIAAKLLVNLISYAASGQNPGLLDLTKPIRWDMAAFRAGAFVSPLQGFLPHSPVYKHEGGSKGLLGADHRIDGFTLVGNYGFNRNGWLTPVPDPSADGWGVLYGSLSHPVTEFILKLRNPGDTPAKIVLKLDGIAIAPPMVIEPGAERTVRWQAKREPGSVAVELRGDQRLVITESRFQ